MLRSETMPTGPVPLPIYDQIRLGILYVNGRSPLEHRFWKNVTKKGQVHPVHGQCWEWTGKRCNNVES
jgi:hypothetical protein